MANSKNQIQRIPLNGSLNMNTLKTEVKQFEGYNEKNSTVFGGTLSPFYVKETQLYQTDNSYTIYNSKGDAYTIGSDTGNLYVNNELINTGYQNGFHFYETIDLGIPDAADWAAYFMPEEYTRCILYIADGVLYGKYAPKGDNDADDKILEQPWTKILDFSSDVRKPSHVNMLHPSGLYNNYNNVITNKQVVIGITYTNISTGTEVLKNYSYIKCIVLDLDTFTVKLNTKLSLTESSPINFSPIVTYKVRSVSSGTIELHVCNMSGKVSSSDPIPTTEQFLLTKNASNNYTLSRGTKGNYILVNPYDTSNGGLNFVRHDIYKEGNAEIRTSSGSSTKIYVDTTYRALEITPYFYCACYIPYTSGHAQGNFSNSFVVSFNSGHDGYSTIPYATGSDGNGFIPNVLGGGFDGIGVNTDMLNLYYKSGSVLGANYGGYPITPYGEVYSDNINIDFNMKLWCNFTYKSSSGWRVCKVAKPTYYLYKNTERKVDLIKSLIIDNKYIWTGTEKGFFDIENNQYVLNSTYYGYIDTDYPVIAIDSEARFNEVYSAGKTGAMYASGFNAGYLLNGNDLIGYLANPAVMTNVPNKAILREAITTKGCQAYLTRGSSVQSATYIGSDPLYFDTVYPIDQNANIIIPFNSDSKIIKGYSNNDFVKSGSTAYPLMYSNINKKLYSYYLLSMLENMEGVFSLQGQQYTVDDNNIYAVSYQNGIIQNAQAVAYKKNMQLLGSLPTQAVFYSYFNKSFYAFTGDRILSKMFEASDIDEIYYVGQNPSSLSLWICTDSGIYIISESDMYKLDYVAKDVSFTEKSVVITASRENESGQLYNYKEEISLYDIENEAERIPVHFKTAYYGIGNEMKSVMDCWYIRLFEPEKIEGNVKVKVSTITDVTRYTEEKIFHITPSDYDENNLVYLRYQPKYQECVAMQLEVTSDLGIYELALGVNPTDSTAQVSKINF